MDLRKLKTLIELVESSGIAELEISEGEERVRITRSLPAPAVPSPPAPLPATALMTGDRAAPSTTSTPTAEPEGHTVKSPMVGTFYRAASPGTKPFVDVGDEDDGAAVATVAARGAALRHVLLAPEGDCASTAPPAADVDCGFVEELHGERGNGHA